jgi:hypothetical protein
MQPKLIVLLLCLFMVTGCRGSETSQNVSNANATEQPSPGSTTNPASPSTQQQTTAAAAVSPNVKPKLDACAMLTSQDIQPIQGEALKEVKLTERSADGLYTSQCFFALPTFTNSISLAVTRSADGPGARNAREFWKDNFHADKERNKEREREKEREEEEGERPPRKIPGIGEEAFWMASPAAGILYVLKGPNYIRISIGGAGDQETKLKKSKALAQKVIERL